MKTLKKLLMAAAFVICVSLSAAAQERDVKKTPPKPNNLPVVPIVPKEKSKEEKQRDERNKDNRGKKPQAFIFRFGEYD